MTFHGACTLRPGAPAPKVSATKYDVKSSGSGAFGNFGALRRLSKSGSVTCPRGAGLHNCWGKGYLRDATIAMSKETKSNGLLAPGRREKRGRMNRVQASTSGGLPEPWENANANRGINGKQNSQPKAMNGLSSQFMEGQSVVATPPVNGKERRNLMEQFSVHEENITGVEKSTMGRSTRAVVLAGGETTNPLTRFRAMPAVQIGSSMLLVDIPINNCLRSGINKIYVLTQFHSHGINSHIAASYPPIHFGGPLGDMWVDVLAAQQTTTKKEWYKGSADAIRKNLNELKDESRGIEPATDYVILSGSAMYNMDLAKVVASHRLLQADVTICTHLVSQDVARTKGVLRVDNCSKVLSFEEKPNDLYLDRARYQDSGKYLANMGVYVFKREAMLDLLDPAKSDVVTHIGHHVIPNALSKGMNVHSYQHKGYWQDVSTLKDYYEANLALASPEAPIKMFEVDGAVSAKGSMLPPSKMQGTVKVSESILGDGTFLVDCEIRNSVVGECIFVGAGSCIEDSLLLGSPFWTSEILRENALRANERVFGVGKNCVLRKCIVDENVSIGDNCMLTNTENVQEADFSSDGYMIQDGILVLLRNAEIPDGTTI